MYPLSKEMNKPPMYFVSPLKTIARLMRIATVCPLILCAMFAVSSRIAWTDESDIPEIQSEDVSTSHSRATQWILDRLWTQIYFESASSSHDRRNIVNDMWIKSGLHLFEIRDKPLDVYLKTRLLHDRNRDFWNNRGELGLGVQYRPIDNLGLVLFAEALYGIYTGREGADTNLNKDPFWDYRGGFYFWQWWGRYPWEIEQNEYYLPFTGWREFYADGIYYYRDDNNFISTLDFKEGLALGRIGPVQFDAFLALESGIDSSSDFWNNYIQVGPGFRLTPFENLDLKLSFEYFWGQYYRGNVENQSDRYSDFVVTLSYFTEF